MPSPVHSTVVMMTQQLAREEHPGSITVPPSPSPSSYLYFTVPNLLVWCFPSHVPEMRRYLPRIFCLCNYIRSWWRHQMETFSALLVICAGNSLVSGELPAQRPPTQGFDFSFFVLIWVWINDWENNREAGDFRRYRAHYDVTVMFIRNKVVGYVKAC